ncbi:hypothetical protein [Paludibaculum fermentans]|uniref:hypothetical protein n=1 Tax=Paludibaculum fermentans TaxID=1473598 RepID=UPI003EBB1D41
MNARSKITSRGALLATAGPSAGAAVIAPRSLHAQNDGSRIVQTMLSAAVNARINILSIRRNISVLDGSGGNIVVLTGKDGKVLIDAGYTVSKPGIAAAPADAIPTNVVAAKPTAEYDSRWGQFLITPRFFTTLVFQGV